MIRVASAPHDAQDRFGRDCAIDLIAPKRIVDDPSVPASDTSAKYDSPPMTFSLLFSQRGPIEASEPSVEAGRRSHRGRICTRRRSHLRRNHRRRALTTAPECEAHEQEMPHARYFGTISGYLNPPPAAPARPAPRWARAARAQAGGSVRARAPRMSRSSLQARRPQEPQNLRPQAREYFTPAQ